MKKYLVKVLFFCMVMAISIGITPVTHAAGLNVVQAVSSGGAQTESSGGVWVPEGSYWTYEINGVKQVSTWILDTDGKYYYLGSDTHMLANTVTPDGYEVGPSGAWDTNPSILSAPRNDNMILYQLPYMKPYNGLMMSYVIKTKNNKIIVIDGGSHDDTAYLRNFIKVLGNHVNLWILTHAHDDHFGALQDILANQQGMVIDTIVSSLNDAAWIQANESDSLQAFNTFMSIYNASPVPKRDLNLNWGSTLPEDVIDGVNIKYLSVRNETDPNLQKGAYGFNGINDQCVTFKITSGIGHTYLFLGDAGVNEGKIIANYAIKITGVGVNSQYVQMSHHGNMGIGLEFYKLVSPLYCLWPTSQALWNNDSGLGDTPIERGWMTSGICGHVVGEDMSCVGYTGLRQINN